MEKEWTGDHPEKCDICQKDLDDKFVDGRVRSYVVWSIMCPECHFWYGCGLGVGLGQRYRKETSASGVRWKLDEDAVHREVR